MFVKNGTEQYELSVGDFIMRSAACDRIELPYRGRVWGDLLLEVERELNERAPEYESSSIGLDGSLEHCRVSVVFRIQKRRIGLLARVSVTDSPAGDFTEDLNLRATGEEVKPILDHFFFCINNGLDDEHLAYFKGVYDQWKNT